MQLLERKGGKAWVGSIAAAKKESESLRQERVVCPQRGGERKRVKQKVV